LRRAPKKAAKEKVAKPVKTPPADPHTQDIRTPDIYLPLLKPARYKGMYGGRGSGKSHFFAEMLIEKCILNPGTRAVCIREVQKSLDQSVKLLLEDKIKKMKAEYMFRVLNSHIETPGGGIILFQGMQNHTAESVKSLEGYDVSWVEEAQSLSQRSLDLLRPTIRKPGSELWFSWNPGKATDPIDVLLRSEVPPFDACVVEVNWCHNSYFPDVLHKELTWDRARDPDKYAHVWLGEYNVNSSARVFRNYRSEELEIPADARPLFGADWGFAVDPTTGVRCWLLNERLLYIDREVYEVGCEIDATPALFSKLNDDRIPDVRKWAMRGDSARPETISYMNRQGFTMVPSTKGAGSVDEGVAFLKSVDIVVHPRCVHVLDELLFYSYEVDKLTGKVLPVLRDKKNHMIDAIRYALEDARKSLHGIIEFYRQEAAKATQSAFGTAKPVELPSVLNGGVRMRAPAGTSTAYGMTGTKYDMGADGLFIIATDDVAPLRSAGFVQVG
jgi:phage terminase large subunit